MKIIVTTGVQFADHRPPITFEAELGAEAIDGIEPDDVFVATNRINEAEVDVRNLPTQWQRDLRLALDDAKAASMSVDDTYSLVSDAGTVVTTMRCARVGWDVVAS